MAKVFLSHSSADKDLVGEVYRLLGDRLAEYDAETFEGGLPNWEVIVAAFERCDVFALIATKASLDVKWVRREIGEARRRIRDARLKRMLIFVVDGTPLTDLPSTLREFAMFLTLSKPRSIERAIHRHLLEISGARRAGECAFVGRDEELKELKDQLLNPERPVVGMSVSGLPLQGRAALIRRVLQDVNPAFHPIPRTIDFHIYESCADLALGIHGSMNDLISPDQVSEIKARFVSDDPSTCGLQLFELIQEAAQSRLYPVFSDRGGILDHTGSLSPVARGMVSAAGQGQDLRVFFVTTRRPVPKARTNTAELVFYDLRPMSDAAARQYVTYNARARRLSLNSSQVDAIIAAAKGQVPVLELILERCSQYPAEQALADLTDAQDVIRDRAGAFLQGVEVSDDAARMLGVLNNYFNVPAEFVSAIFEDFEAGASASSELLDLHLVVEAQGIYSVSPPLVDAIARDSRFVLGGNAASDVARTFAQLFSEYSDEGVVPVGSIDAAAIASIETGMTDPLWVNRFILPSHYIYLARRSYDRGDWQRAIDFCESAIAYRSSMTTGAYVHVCRTLGQSAARLGRDDTVQRAIDLLNGASHPLSHAHAAYVRGFSERLLGRFAEAEGSYEDAALTLRADVSLMRELAVVNLLRRQFAKAIDYGEKALGFAANSPYLLDIVARARIAREHDPRALQYDFEIDDVMRRLERACAGKNLSFHDLRSAEIDLALKRLAPAMAAADRAVGKTPDLAAPYLIRARIHLAAGRVPEARADRDLARERTRTAQGRHRYFDSEILRVALEIAVASRRWEEAVSLHRQLRQFGPRDLSELAARIVAGITRDKAVQPDHVKAFAAEHVASRK